MRRIFTWIAVALPALCLVGCGGGGEAPAGDSEGVSTATMEGVILDVDGESAQSGGVPLIIAETGEQAVSAADGTFAFENLPEGDFTLAIDENAPGAAQLAPSFARTSVGDERDDEEGDDETDDAADDTERGDRSVRIRRVRRGDTLFIQIRIEGGRIIEIRITRPDRDDEPPSAGGGERELEIMMHKTDANTDPDMQGEVELSLEANGDQEFEVEVEDATTGDLLEAVVIDPEDNEDSLGFRAVELDGDAEWKLDTGDGDALPFDVEHLRELEGYRVVVRDDQGVDLLRARIPDLPPHGDDMDARCFRLRARARLRPHVDGVRGYVAARAAGCRIEGEIRFLRQVFKIAGEGFDVGQEIEFFLEDPDNEGTLVSLGTVLANADGEAEIVFDTHDGDELPFGVASIRELRGLAVQVRDDVTGDILLSSRVADPIED